MSELQIFQETILRMDGELKAQRNLKKSIVMHLTALKPSLSFHTEDARYQLEEIIKLLED